MRKIFLVAIMALMLAFSVGVAQEFTAENPVNENMVVLDDILVGHAPSVIGQFALPVTPLEVGVGLGYFEGSFIPKFALFAGKEGFFGTVAAYPTAGENEWPVEFGIGYDAAITEWGGLRVDYTWVIEKNMEEIEYNQSGVTGELGVGFWANFFD